MPVSKEMDICEIIKFVNPHSTVKQLAVTQVDLNLALEINISKKNVTHVTHYPHFYCSIFTQTENRNQLISHTLHCLSISHL